MRLIRSSNAWSLKSRKGTRVLLMRGQRSAGRQLMGPVFISTEWHNHNRVRYFHLTVGDPCIHRRWAFSLYTYFTLGGAR